MRYKEFINEKLTKVSGNVDWIYNEYFAEAFNYIKKNGTVEMSLLHKASFTSDRLNSRLSKLADRKKPITIYINFNKGNTYNPVNNEIHLNIHQEAWGFAEQEGSIKNAVELLSGQQKKHFLREFVPETIKGSIHHELNHWIDDALHNNHIGKHVRKAADSGVSPQDNVGTHERNSQIHNIVQLKRKLKDRWDTLSFKEMTHFIPSMGHWSSQLEPEEHALWKKNLLRRMARENLLGKGMVRT